MCENMSDLDKHNHGLPLLDASGVSEFVSLVSASSFFAFSQVIGSHLYRLRGLHPFPWPMESSLQPMVHRDDLPRHILLLLIRRRSGQYMYRNWWTYMEDSSIEPTLRLFDGGFSPGGGGVNWPICGKSQVQHVVSEGIPTHATMWGKTEGHHLPIGVPTVEHGVQPQADGFLEDSQHWENRKQFW